MGSNDTLGTMILKFGSLGEMNEMIDNMENDIRVLYSRKTTGVRHIATCSNSYIQ